MNSRLYCAGVGTRWTCEAVRERVNAISGCAPTDSAELIHWSTSLRCHEELSASQPTTRRVCLRPSDCQFGSLKTVQRCSPKPTVNAADAEAGSARSASPSRTAERRD